jgi:hypothetical protein
MNNIADDIANAYDEGFADGIKMLGEKIKNIYTVHDGLWAVIDRLTKELIDHPTEKGGEQE